MGHLLVCFLQELQCGSGRGSWVDAALGGEGGKFQLGWPVLGLSVGLSPPCDVGKDGHRSVPVATPLPSPLPALR